LVVGSGDLADEAVLRHAPACARPEPARNQFADRLRLPQLGRTG
jgi:hypothetical protein